MSRRRRGSICYFAKMGVAGVTGAATHLGGRVTVSILLFGVVRVRLGVVVVVSVLRGRHDYVQARNRRSRRTGERWEVGEFKCVVVREKRTSFEIFWIRANDDHIIRFPLVSASECKFEEGRDKKEKSLSGSCGQFSALVEGRRIWGKQRACDHFSYQVTSPQPVEVGPLWSLGLVKCPFRRYRLSILVRC